MIIGCGWGERVSWGSSASRGQAEGGRARQARQVKSAGQVRSAGLALCMEPVRWEAESVAAVAGMSPLSPAASGWLRSVSNVYTDQELVSGIALRFDSLRAESYRASESLALIERLERTWEAGASPLTQTATAGLRRNRLSQ